MSLKGRVLSAGVFPGPVRNRRPPRMHQGCDSKPPLSWEPGLPSAAGDGDMAWGAPGAPSCPSGLCWSHKCKMLPQLRAGSVLRPDSEA